MRVRPTLPWPDARSLMLHEPRCLTEGAIGMHGISRHAAPAVIGNIEPFAGLVERQMTWSGAYRRDLVQLFQLTGFSIDREGGYTSARLSLKSVVFIYRIQESLVRVNRQERGIAGLGHQSYGCQLTRRGLEAPGVNALAVLAGIGADINKHFLLRDGIRRQRRKRECGNDQTRWNFHGFRL